MQWFFQAVSLFSGLFPVWLSTHLYLQWDPVETGPKFLPLALPCSCGGSGNRRLRCPWCSWQHKSSVEMSQKELRKWGPSSSLHHTGVQDLSFPHFPAERYSPCWAFGVSPGYKVRTTQVSQWQKSQEWRKGFNSFTLSRQRRVVQHFPVTNRKLLHLLEMHWQMYDVRREFIFVLSFLSWILKRLKPSTANRFQWLSHAQRNSCLLWSLHMF